MILVALYNAKLFNAIGLVPLYLPWEGYVGILLERMSLLDDALDRVGFGFGHGCGWARIL